MLFGQGGQRRCSGAVTVKQSPGWNEGGTWVLLEKNFPKEIVVRTKARDSEDKGQRQDVLGVVQDRKEAGVIRAGMGGGRRSG